MLDVVDIHCMGHRLWREREREREGERERERGERRENLQDRRDLNCSIEAHEIEGELLELVGPVLVLLQMTLQVQTGWG